MKPHQLMGFFYAKNMIKEIQELLKSESESDYKEFLMRIVPTAKKVYGVRVAIINNMVKEYKVGGIELVEQLWKSGAYEERLLAAKILGKHAKKNPEKVFQLIYDFSEDLLDWAICDTLAMQALKPLVENYKNEIWEISDDLIKSKNEWKRRFALVCIEYYTRFPDDHARIKKQLKKVEKDQEHYVKKAVKWLERNMKKKG